MFVSPNRFIVLFRAAVFADLGLQGIDVNAEVFSHLGDVFVRSIRQLDR
jgi:hypothetical protein